MLVPSLNREECYLRELMEADAAVRPALLREWSRLDEPLGERLTAMFHALMRPDDEQGDIDSAGGQQALG